MSDERIERAISEPPPARMSAEVVSDILRRGRAITDEVRERAVQLAPRGQILRATGQPAYPRVIGTAITTSLQPDFRHPFFADVLEGLKERAVASGYDLLFFSGPVSGDSTAEFSYVARCRRHDIAGVILMGSSHTDPELGYLIDEEIPTVAIDLDLVGARAGYVMSENVEAAATVVEYLRTLDYKRIAHISGSSFSRPGADRVLGYRSGLEREYLPFREEYLIEGDFYEPSGYTGMEQLLALEERPDAVFCASDTMALGAIRAAHAGGLRVPDDIAVVGFDDISFAAMMEPALTTVHQDKPGLGAAACEALLRIIDGTTDGPPVVILPTELIVRESCGAKLKASQNS